MSSCDGVRRAVASDVDHIIHFDHIARASDRRRDFIRRTVHAGQCYVRTAGGRPVAYAVLDYSFYDNGWIAMLYVSADHRRRGHGEELVCPLERECREPKLFTSTNQSNAAMQGCSASSATTPAA
jgi:GNAT superfamily N-acetyltransferase